LTGAGAKPGASDKKIRAGAETGASGKKQSELELKLEPPVKIWYKLCPNLS